MKSDEDETVQLLDAAREGDQSAINELLDRYRSFLTTEAESRPDPALESKIAPSDIVQQSMLEAFNGLPEFRGATDKELRTWLTRIVKNNRRDAERFFIRAKRRDVRREAEVEVDALAGREKTASSNIRTLESRLELWKAIRQLPERHQQLVELRHRDGLSFHEIGERLGMSEAAARKQWSRSLDELRKYLES